MKEFFDYLRSNGITPNQFYVLWDMGQPIGYPDYVNTPIARELLVGEGLLYKETNKFHLTDKAYEILEGANRFFSNKSAISTEQLKIDWKEQIEEFRSIFPKGKQGNVPIRTAPSELTERFVWFFNKFPQYSWDDVLKATREYVSSFMGNYQYIKTAGYFIKKEDKFRTVTSVLLTYLENPQEEIRSFEQNVR